MLRLFKICISIAGVGLSGCGTYVPALAEYPMEPGSEQDLVAAIVFNIKCDISKAVVQFIDKDVDAKTHNFGRRSGQWIDGWGAQVALTLTVEEKSGASPNAVGMPPSPASALFSVGGNLSASADATRTDKSNFFFTVKELYQRGGCATGIQPEHSPPSLLIQNDLKIKDWLFDQLIPSGSGEVTYSTSTSGVFKQNVLSHEVKFEVVTTGGLNPAWKLTRATVNQAGGLFSASRNRTSDLIVTFGPLDSKDKSGSLIAQAEYSHLVSQIGVANSINLSSPNVQFSIFQ